MSSRLVGTPGLRVPGSARLTVSADQWNTPGRATPFSSPPDQIIGCAGLHLDTDQPARGENALTGVRRDSRGQGVASHLKRRTLSRGPASRLARALHLDAGREI